MSLACALAGCVVDGFPLPQPTAGQAVTREAGGGPFLAPTASLTVPAPGRPGIITLPTTEAGRNVAATSTPAALTAGALPPTAAATPAPAAVTPAATAVPPSAALPLPAGNAVEILLSQLVEPEDVTLAPGGDLYFSSLTEGTVERYGRDGKRETVCTSLSGPEGIAVLPDGGVVVAEQVKNRLTLCRTGKPNQVILQLENRTGRLGVDGIALDETGPGDSWLIVPDSANGTVLRVSLDGKQVRQIGRGFVRPVGAWVEKDGSILVADEFGLALKRLRADGKVETVAELPTPDDVIEDGRGNIYVSTLGDNAIHLITPDGASKVLVQDLASPQGLTFDIKGNLVVAETGRGRLVRMGLPNAQP